MKLKSLEIQGFKSFDDKTIVNFDDYITGVVGPNGCGKSNIVDAIRWVMGEQSAKHLRGRAMEDIIFSGTQNRSPNSLAQVELTFETDGEHVPPQFTGCKEISVGRKLYRTGESEYYINKQPSRLKDITDFFLGTGVGTKAYSIIEQGRVGQIVMSKPEERRRIIEEAAGISKFKARKDAAQRKMEATSTNLSRLHDIIQEIERQKGTLERQAKKAAKFKLIKDELMDLDLKLAALNYEKFEVQQKELLEKIKEFDVKEQDTQMQVTEDEAWVEEERLKLVEVETQLNDLQQEVFEWDNQLKLIESRIHNKKEHIQRHSQEIESLDGQVDELVQEYQGSQNGLQQVNEKLAIAELDSAELDVSVGEQESELQELETSSKELFSTLELARERYNAANSELTSIKARRESLTERLAEITGKQEGDQLEQEDLNDKCKSLEKLLGDSKKDLGEIKQLQFSLGEKTETLTEDLNQEEETLQKERQELGSIKEELLQKKSRLHSLEELERNFEGYQQGPKEILKKKQEGELSGVLASVAEVIEAEPKYENAISAVLGERMQYLVVQNHTDGMQCAEYLKEAQAGRSSFIPVSMAMEADSPAMRQVAEPQKGLGYNVYTENYLKPLDSEQVETVDFEFNTESPIPTLTADFSKHPGVQGFLNSYLKLKPGYENLNRMLFGDVMLVDNLKNAIDAWASMGSPAVTLDGELVAKDGTLTGGSLENTSKALLSKKREIKELGTVIQELVDRVKAKEEVCFDLDKKIKGIKAEIEGVKSTSHEEELKLAKQEKDVLHFTKDLENLNSRRGKLSQQIYNATETMEQLQMQLDGLVEDETEQQKIYDEALELLENKKSEEEKCREELASRQESLTKGKIALAQAKEQRSFLLQEVDRLIAEKIRLRFEIVRLEENSVLSAKRKSFEEDRVTFLEKLIKKVIENKDAADENYHQKKDEFEVINGSVLERESKLKEARHDYNGIRDELNKSTVALTEVRGALSRLNEQVMERYQLMISSVYQDHIPNLEEFDPIESEGRATELRHKLGSIGNVNLSAIDELEEISERFEFLTKQRDDLEESLASLERAIQKINRTTKERFASTFELVNDKFQKLFPRLFKGGHAYMQMTDPENILETGIDIISQPPGKKLQSISLLSGGEKALTAVSLLFAIFLIKPAPFCLLDEVDAPLDDANVDRYNEIVKEMSQRTQFIVITHNKRTMQVTDCLFGVTMQEPGVSQLVSVQLNADA